MSSTPLTASGGRFRLRDLVPFGPRRHPRPRPFLEMLEVAWENRDGSIKVILNAVPLKGELLIRDPRPFDELRRPAMLPVG